MLALLARKGCLALLFILIARLAGPDSLGKYVFAYSVISVATLLSAFGLSPLSIRETARLPEQASPGFMNVLLLRLLLSVVAVACVEFFLHLSAVPSDTRLVVVVMAIAIVPGTVIDQIQTVFSGLQQMEYVAITSLVQWLVVVLLSAYSLSRFRNLWMISAAQVVGFTVGMVIAGWFLMSNFFVPKFKVDLSIWTKFLREAAPLAIQAFFGILYFRVGTIMLSLMTGDAAVGWFGSAFHINEALQLIPMSIAAALLPQVSAGSDVSAVRKIAWPVLKYNLIAALPISMGISLLAPQIVVLVYGNSFSQSAIVLRITIWALVPIFLNFVMGTLFIAIGRQKIVAMNAIACCVLSVPLNYLLIRKASYVGASVATICTESLLLLLNYYFIRRYVGGLHLGRIVAGPVLATLVMGAISFWLQRVSGLVIVILVSASVYVISLFAFRSVSWKEFAALRSAD